MSNEMESAVKLRASVEARIRQTRSDPDLSDQKKASSIAAARETTNKQLADLHDQHRAGRAATHEKLRGRLFGIGHKATATEADRHAKIASYRDAQFRVQGLESKDEAQRLLERARFTGDALLMRAIASLAYERNWHDVLDFYAEAEGSEATLEDLRAFERSIFDRNRQFAESVAFGAIQEEDSAERLGRVVHDTLQTLENAQAGRYLASQEVAE